MKPYFASKPYRQRKESGDNTKKTISYASQPLKFRKTKHNNAIVHYPNNNEKDSKHENHIPDGKTEANFLSIDDAKHALIDNIFFEIVLEARIIDLHFFLFLHRRNHWRCWFRDRRNYLGNFLRRHLLWFFRNRNDNRSRFGHFGHNR